MDVTKLSGVFSSTGNIQMEVFSPEHTQAPILDVTDVVSLSGENKDGSRQELIEETLLLSLMDRMDKLEGVVERLEQMTAIPYHPVAPPMSQNTTGDDTGLHQGVFAPAGTFTPVPVTAEPGEDSPIASPQARADVIASRYSSVTSSLDSSIGNNVDVVVGDAVQGGMDAAAGIGGVAAAAGMISALGPGMVMG